MPCTKSWAPRLCFGMSVYCFIWVSIRSINLYRRFNVSKHSSLKIIHDITMLDCLSLAKPKLQYRGLGYWGEIRSISCYYSSWDAGSRWEANKGIKSSESFNLQTPLWNLSFKSFMYMDLQILISLMETINSDTLWCAW